MWSGLTCSGSLTPSASDGATAGSDETAAKVAVGELLDGRWYVRMYGGDIDPRTEQAGCTYAGPHAEHYARGTARRWMRTVGGEWVEA